MKAETNEKKELTPGTQTMQQAAAVSSPLFESGGEFVLPDYLPTLRQTGAPAELLQTFQAFSSRLDAHETLLYNAAMISSYLEIIISILLGLFGNRLYYRFVLRKVHKLVQEDVSPDMKRRRLRQEGGVNGWFLVAMLGIQMGASIIFSLIMMLVMLLS